MSWHGKGARTGDGRKSRAIPLAPPQATLEPFIFEWTLAAQGSISAEHGLGQSKAAWLPRAKPPAVVAVMRGLKALLDPAGILNPGVLVDV